MSEEDKTILYVQTSGTDTPERLYAPFVLSQLARAMYMNAIIYFLGKGLTVIQKGEAEKIQLPNFPVLKESIDQALEAGVKLYACQQSAQLFGMERTDFIDGVKIVGAATLNDLVVESDGTMWF
jgi:hypothetical protein